jgi:hypothetical protein
MAEEVSIYQDANIHVTNLRTVLHGKTYAMANVTSVSTFTEPAKKAPGIVLAVIGGLLVLSGLPGGDLQGCFLTIGLPLLVVGIAAAWLAKDVYWIRIGSASGEANALSSRDHGYIARIVNAMNEAIVRRW